VALFNQIKDIEKALPYKANKLECEEFVTVSQFRELEEACLDKISKVAVELDNKVSYDELDNLEQEIVMKSELDQYM